MGADPIEHTGGCQHARYHHAPEQQRDGPARGLGNVGHVLGRKDPRDDQRCDAEQRREHHVHQFEGDREDDRREHRKRDVNLDRSHRCTAVTGTTAST